MSGYRPTRAMTHGVPYPVAEAYGKPHFLCTYTGKSVNATKMFDGATCMCCGKLATNAHHWPPKGTAPTFTWHQDGRKLRPALFAVCGTGTMGCHDGWHGGARFRALWRWDSDEYARDWWEGDMLEKLGEHSNALYRYGCWELYDFRDGTIREVRL